MRRPGVTLIEVLAAIAIMGIGMLAVLVLFPLGALAIGRALKDDRCAAIAPNAHAMAAAMKIGNDRADIDDPDPSLTVPPPVSTNPTFGTYNVLDDVFVPPIENKGEADYQKADPNRMGYPVYVDPFYVYSGVTGNLGEPNPMPAKYFVYRHVARRSPLFLRQLKFLNDVNFPAADMMERFFAFTDDLTFRPNGFPKNGGSNVYNTKLERQGLYTWAYMIRRLKSSAPTTLQLQVVVYSGRPIESPDAEETYKVLPVGGAQPGEGATSFELTWTDPKVTKLTQRPELRRGMWLYDSTYTRITDTTSTPNTDYGYVNGGFYRIMDVTDLENGTSLQVEVQPPLRMPDPRMKDPNNVNLPAFTTSRMTLLPGAVEVFERGNLRD